MVVWVVEWGCIFEMDVDGFVVGQVVSHYILVEPACYLGSSSVEQAFGAVLVEQEAMVVVEQVVEAKEREESCTGPPPLTRCIPLRLWLSIGVKWMSSWLSKILRRR